METLQLRNCEGDYNMPLGDFTLLRKATSIMTTQGDGTLEDLEVALTLLEEQVSGSRKRSVEIRRL